jgi:endonuclease-3
MSSSGNDTKERALKIFGILKDVYPDAKPLLNYSNAFELLVGTVLAAQCTDARVNQVTPLLFEKCPAPADMLCFSQKELEAIIRPTGFFRNKAKNLKELCFALSDRHHGEIPGTIEELVKLPGIGRKTANVIAGHCFGVPAIVVDTHFIRLSGRLGLTQESKPEKIEQALRVIIPEEIQTQFSDIINWHGRFRCKARKPDCPACEVAHLCPYPEKTPA